MASMPPNVKCSSIWRFQFMPQVGESWRPMPADHIRNNLKSCLQDTVLSPVSQSNPQKSHPARAAFRTLSHRYLKVPKKVIHKDSAKKTAKKSCVKAFIKMANYNHIMPTRYTLDENLKDVVTSEVLQSKDKR